MKAKSVAVKQKLAEKTRKQFLQKDIIISDLKIKKENGMVYIPIKEDKKIDKKYKIIIKNFEKNKKKVKNYKEIISLPESQKNELPSSFDIIGNILLLKLEQGLQNYKKEIGKSFLDTNKNIKTVCLVKPIRGEYRTRSIEIIAGDNNTETTHTEFGLKIKLDIEKTYFSPRLANERRRIAGLVKKGEIIVDMFTGVAPFSLMIAKYADPKIIYAIDKNKYAIKYAQENVKKNNVLNKIEIIYEDAGIFSHILNKKDVKANRIIMNLPFSSYLFFKNALDIIDSNGIIHYYDILAENEIEKRIEYLEKTAEKKKKSLKIKNIKKIKSYAPREFYIGIDIMAKKMPM